MAGYAVYSVLPTPPGENHCAFEEKLAKRWVDLIGVKAADEGIKLPKRIMYSGCYGSSITMNYTSNGHRVAMQKAAAQLGLTFLRGRHQGVWVEG